MEMKNVWLVNPVAMPPQYEVRVQTLKRAEYLVAKGLNVTIISGSYLHNIGVNISDNEKPYIMASYGNGINFIHIKTISYGNSNLKRLFNLLQFYWKLLKYCKEFPVPNVISAIAMVPFSILMFPVARKVKAKIILDVVDLWPESFVAYKLISAKNPITKFLYWIERMSYIKADRIIFSMEGGTDYLIEKNWINVKNNKIDRGKIYYINNGVDINDFDFNKNNTKLEDIDLQNEKLFNIIYIGSIRKANNVIQLVKAAKYLLKYDNIQILIYGDGPDRSNLISYCKKNKINNVKFKNKWVPLANVPYILSKSSLNILNYMDTPILRFGGSQSKSFQYMASGKPICANVEMKYCPITKYELGIAKRFASSLEYAEALLSIYQLTETEYLRMCFNARKAAFNYDYKILTDRFIEILDELE